MGKGVSPDAEKGGSLLYSAVKKGYPKAIKLYNALQVKAQQMDAKSTEPSAQTTSTAIKHYHTALLKPTNFKQVHLLNLNTETIAHSFYTVTSSRARQTDDYWGKGEYYYINAPNDLNGFPETVVSIAPVFVYQNPQDETRYLVPVEISATIGKTIDTLHAILGVLELYLFKKVSNGQFQLVSKSAQGGIEGMAGYSQTSWNAEEFRKNI